MSEHGRPALQALRTLPGRRWSRWPFAALALGFAAACMADPSAARWPLRHYNPSPLENDLVLPLPCGGAMAFRPVDTRVSGWLDEQRVVLGAIDEGNGLAEYARRAHLAGPFPAGEGKRRFWLGKYEVTQAQWRSLDGDCTPPAMRDRHPVTGVDWFGAVRFAHRWSAWLHVNARDQLPRNGTATGFVRLPTEDEWEFAARGGVAVSDQAFGQPVFPMTGPASRYVWHDGADSAAGKVRITGLLEPNPLGLFDMLGNVEEIALDAFRVHKVVRLHGQPGGFVTRGGHFFTPPDRIRVSYRREHAHFDARTGLPAAVATVGFRLAISAVVIADRERLQLLKIEWKGQPRRRIRRAE